MSCDNGGDQQVYAGFDNVLIGRYDRLGQYLSRHINIGYLIPKREVFHNRNKLICLLNLLQNVALHERLW
jgi:hypothetical protein